MDKSLPFDIYGLVPYTDYLKIILIAIVILAIAIGLWFLVKFIVSKFKKNRKQEAKKTPLELMDEILVKLKKEDSNESEGAFYEKISMLFREGLELGLGFTATSMTIGEIKDHIMRSFFLDRDKHEIMQFFKVADLVKFSTHTTSENDRLIYREKLTGWLEVVKKDMERKILEEEKRKQEQQNEKQVENLDKRDN